MQPRVMVTNGGVHPPEKHAETTAWKILDLVRIPEEPIAADNPDRASIETGRENARQTKAVLEPQLAALFLPYHRKVQDGEREALKSEGAARLNKRQTHVDLVDENAVLAEVNALFAGSAFAQHYAKPDVQVVLKHIIDSEFDRAIGDERSWFADEPADGSAAKAHHDKYFKGVRRDRNDPALKAYRQARAERQGGAPPGSVS